MDYPVQLVILTVFWWNSFKYMFSSRTPVTAISVLLPVSGAQESPLHPCPLCPPVLISRLPSTTQFCLQLFPWSEIATPLTLLSEFLLSNLILSSVLLCHPSASSRKKVNSHPSWKNKRLPRTPILLSIMIPSLLCTPHQNNDQVLLSSSPDKWVQTHTYICTYTWAQGFN